MSQYRNGNAMSEPILTQAESLLDNGDFAKALHLFEELIKAEPENAIAYQGASIARLNLDNYSEALELSYKALDLDSMLTIPHTTLAYIYDELGDKAKSREEAKIALSMDIESPEALFCSGFFSLLDNKLDDAIRYLEKAVKIHPSLYLAQYNLATAYQKSGDSKKLLRQTVILFGLKPNARSLLRLMYMLTRAYRFADLPILLVSVILSLRVGARFILAVTALLVLVYLGGGIFIGFMARDRQWKQLLINILMGIGTGLFGLALYFWVAILGGK